MRRTEIPKPIWIKFCTVVDIADVVTKTNFGDHRLRGCWVAGVKFPHLPLTFIVALTTLSHYRTSVWYMGLSTAWHGGTICTTCDSSFFSQCMLWFGPCQKDFWHSLILSGAMIFMHLRLELSVDKFGIFIYTRGKQWTVTYISWSCSMQPSEL